METISAHGGLIRVYLLVNSASVSGIDNLIMNSPGLIKLHVSTKQLVQECGECTSVHVHVEIPS